jgi:hypothetical protein
LHPGLRLRLALGYFITPGRGPGCDVGTRSLESKIGPPAFCTSGVAGKSQFKNPFRLRPTALCYCVAGA